MKISAYLKKTGLVLLAAAALCCALTACNGVIYDEEGDCSVTYRVVFRYDRNMLWTDAFAREVGSVHLYAFDKNGVLAWERSERGEQIVAQGNSMLLDLPAGDYTLVAWCGLENDGERPESFSVPRTLVGSTRIEELQCRLNSQADPDDDQKAYSSQKLYPLFHGTCEVTLPTNDDGGSYTYPMELTKDTNHVRIILQQLSGEPVDEQQFTFRIEEENGLMGWDNGLLPDRTVIYSDYAKTSGTAGMGIEDYPEIGTKRRTDAPSRAITQVNVAIADLSTARLMADRKAWLTVETVEGVIAARIPLTDYALLLKDGYDEPMTDQEYLDRQDEYTLTFFLDEDKRWTAAWLIINSWRVVRHEVDLE